MKTPSKLDTVTSFHGLGAAFFPEHHPQSTWKEYVRRLHEAGLRFVRLAEFTWDKMEPREGRFDFAWLDEVLRLLAAKRIRAILCTPTAVPPIWACEKYPDIHPVLESGKPFGFGLRRYTCPTSTTYRRLNAGLVAELAHRYGRNPQILGWQLDNEFGHPFCFCDRCRRRFQEWCRRRYHTIPRFNDALCTHFLGQTVTQFGQIPLPNTYPHPGLWLIYHQFFSDMTIACFREQADTLRKHGARAPITTNMMVTWHGYDHEKMGAHLDVIAGDHYGLGKSNIFSLPGDDFPNEAFTNAFLRSAKHGQDIWFHEFQFGRAGGCLPLPGRVRGEVLCQIGLGANLIDFFRLDSCPNGMERDGYGLLRVHRKPGRVYHEVRALARDLKRIEKFVDGSIRPRAEIAFLFTHDNHCSFARSPQSAEFEGPSGNGWSMHLARHFGTVTRQNIPCDIVYPHDDFDAYRVIVAPSAYILPRELAAKLEAFVDGGGTLLLTSLSGHADENGTIWSRPVPAHLTQVFGIEVIDYGEWHAEAAGAMRITSCAKDFSFEPIENAKWLDEIRPIARSTEILARLDNPFFKDQPLITRHRHRKGMAYYLGTLLDVDGYAQFYRAFCQAVRLRPILELPAGLYATERRKGRTRILFINNPGKEPREFDLGGAWIDLFSNRKTGDLVKLASYEARVFAKPTL